MILSKSEIDRSPQFAMLVINDWISADSSTVTYSETCL